ncbi:MAG: hypothetical protein SFW64_05610, partial [Alphaproteobacteria bacterium]|nr:hypothetical protein [Alphaproteobacteria bacterium]
MFIFHILFSLLTLPFVLLRMAFGLFGISTHLLLFPLRMFARHTVLFLVVGGVLILYFAVKSDPHSLDTLKPAPKAERPAKNAKGAPIVIEPITKVENGDSAFATDTYTMMTDPERAAYSRAFYAVMNTVVDGEAGNWDFHNIQGSIRPV